MSDRPDRFNPAHRTPVDYYLDRCRHLTPAKRRKWEADPAKALRRVLAEWNATAIDAQPSRLVRDDIRLERIEQLVAKPRLAAHESLELDRLFDDLVALRKEERRARKA